VQESQVHPGIVARQTCHDAAMGKDKKAKKKDKKKSREDKVKLAAAKGVVEEVAAKNAALKVRRQGRSQGCRGGRSRRGRQGRHDPRPPRPRRATPPHRPISSGRCGSAPTSSSPTSTRNPIPGSTVIARRGRP
jgi:hypothetical protein